MPLYDPKKPMDPATEAIAQRIAQLVVNALSSSTGVNSPPSQTIDRHELQSILNCKTAGATYRVAKRLGISPYLRGKYRRKDVENAIARMSLLQRTHFHE